MAKPNFTLPNKPAIKSGSILSYNYTDDFTFVPAPLTFNRDSAATRVNEKGLIEDVGYFGPELVQNGDFSEIGSEWFNANNIYPRDGATNTINSDGTITTELNNSNIGWNLNSSAILNQNKIYKVEWKVISTNSNSGTFWYWNGVEQGGFGDLTQVGSGVYYVKGNASGANANFRFNNAQLNSTITWSLSVKEVGQNWTFGTGWSIGDGVVSLNSPTGNLEQSLSVTSGSKYRVTFTISNYVSGDVRWRFTGTSNENGTLRSANGTYTEEITLTNSQSVFRFSPTGGVMDIDNISVVEVLGDKPRIDYSDSLTEPSLLLEPQSTNLIPYSEDFSDSYWLKFATNLTITPNAIISPTGQTDASKLVSGSTNAQQAIYRNITKSNCTLSVFAKKAEFDTIALKLSGSQVSKFDLSDGTIGYNTNVTPSIESLGNGWYRCSITIDSSSSAYAWIAIDSGNTQGDESSGIYIWGAQLEELSYATSYIPTAGSTATRLGETANNAGDVNVFNSEEGVFYAEIAALADNDISYRSIFISDGTNNNRVGIRFSNIINKIQALSYKDASLQGFGDYILSSSEQFNKIAFKYKASDFALWVNGVEVQADSSGDVYTVGTLNNINFSAIGGQDFYGKIKNLQVFNKTLTDRELEILTIQ
jgi:hypothetical protein